MKQDNLIMAFDANLPFLPAAMSHFDSICPKIERSSAIHESQKDITEKKMLFEMIESHFEKKHGRYISFSKNT